MSTSIRLHADDLLVRLTVDDARTAQDAGAEFARDMTDARPADFARALADLQDQIERAVAEARFSAEQAWLAAEHFKVAAWGRWERSAGASSVT